MPNVTGTHEKTLRMVQIAFLAALVAVLQVVSVYVKIGAFPLSLVLIPVMLGGAMFGIGAGAFLGGVFGFITLMCGLTGLDPATLELVQLNAGATIAIALCKGICAGAAAALVYKLIRKLSKKSPIPAAIIAAATAPVVNTAVFCAGMVLFFNNALLPLLALIIFNVIFEFAVNVILCPILTGVLYKSKRYKALF